MKLSSKIGRVSLNSMSKKQFKFDSNVFFHFKDRFLKVLATNVVIDGMLLMFNRDGKPHFLFYWQSDPTRYKSYDVGYSVSSFSERSTHCFRWSSA